MHNGTTRTQPAADIEQTYWLTEKEVAAITRISLSTLRAHRFIGRGIPYSKLGRAVRYSAAEVQNYMVAHQIKPRK
ncbi:MAG TPA: transcriptional regulator [Desulfovibrio sp.]|uniref:helix-turn-helix domain-containing protein n=1 Tax=Nitratidesulfovibrio liaohensis TaxID=2604158 RepID=UPI000E859259|nr:transcriptional regulator [Desulfovibrio sp.]